MFKTIFITFMLVCTSYLFAQKHPDGPFKTYFDTGELKQEGAYRNDKKVGQWKDYYKNGQLSRSYIYAPNGLYSGIEEQYTKKGVLAYKAQVNSEMGLDVVHYFSSGEFRAESSKKFFKKEKEFIVEGLGKQYYQEGGLQSEGIYKDGLLEGIWKSYYNSGELEWEVTYVKGMLSGVYKKYYKNGTLEIEGQCQDGFKEGIEKRYNTNGELQKRFKYKQGVLKSGKKDQDIQIPYGEIQRPPVFPNCEGLNVPKARKCMSKKIAYFLGTNFNHSFVGQMGLKGEQTIIVKFKIDKKGSPIKINAESSHRALEAEAIRLIALLPKSRPGVLFGEPVITPIYLPVKFMIK